MTSSNAMMSMNVMQSMHVTLMHHVRIALVHTTVNVIMDTLVMVMNAVISTSVVSMSVTAMPNAPTTLVITHVIVMMDILVMVQSVMTSMNVTHLLVTKMLPAPTMMVRLLAHVIMDILVMVSTHVMNWMNWPSTIKILENGRVLLAITGHHFHAKMTMNAISILAPSTHFAPILLVLSNANVMMDIPVMGSNVKISTNVIVPRVTMPAVSILMDRFIAIVILDILVMGSTAKNLTKEPNSTPAAACGLVPKVLVALNLNAKMSTNVSTCPQNVTKCQHAQTQWALIDAHVWLDTVVIFYDF